MRVEQIGDATLYLGVIACDGAAHVLRVSSTQGSQFCCLPYRHLCDGRLRSGVERGLNAIPLKTGVRVFADDGHVLSMSGSHNRLRRVTFRFRKGDDLPPSQTRRLYVGSRSFSRGRASETETAQFSFLRNRTRRTKDGPGVYCCSCRHRSEPRAGQIAAHLDRVLSVSGCSLRYM